jgi:DNA-binding NarL/FixJ family response regulator
LLAARIPGARLVLLESANHILLADALSPRELEVLELVAAGLTNDAIATRLCLSVRTVERHLSNVYVKLRVSGKAGRAAAAARFAESLRADRHAVPGGLRDGTDAGAGDRP